MRYQRACSLVAATALVASVMVATTSRTQVSPVVRTIAVGRAPLVLAVDGQTRRVFVANFGSATVRMLDAGTGTVLATTAVVPYPGTLAIAMKAGRIFVASGVAPMNPDRVDVLDARSGRLLRTVAVGRGIHAVAADERSGHVFVTNGMDNSVSMVDLHSGAVLRTIAVGPSPLAVTVDEHVGQAFVLNAGPWYHGSSSGYGTVKLLDTGSGAVLHTVAVGLGASALAVAVRSGYVFVANSGDATVSMLDTHTGTVVHTITVGLHPSALAVDEGSGHVFVANQDDNSVSTVDAASGRVVRTVPLGLPPRAIAVDPRRGRVVVLTSEEFVPAASPSQVLVLEGRTGRRLHTVAVGADASALALDERTGQIFATAMNVYGLPGGSDTTGLLRAWLGRWLPRPWASRLLPPAPAMTTGTVTMLDLARLSA